MENDYYKEFSRFRVNTLHSIKSKRDPKHIFRDIDKELVRIANSINKGYTLGAIRYKDYNELYRPYRYFEITWTRIEMELANTLGVRQIDFYNSASLDVVIARGDLRLRITEENWTKFFVWATQWKAAKPKTLEECEVEDFYKRWW